MTSAISNASKSNNLTDGYIIAKLIFFVHCQIRQIKKTVLVNLDNRHSRKAKLPDPDIGETYPFYLKPEVLFSDF